MPLSPRDLSRFRHPHENLAFILSILVVAPIALGFAVAVVLSFGVALLPVLGVYIALWFSMRLATAWFLGNLVKVNRYNFPEVHHMIRAKQEYFSYRGAVDAYIVSDASYNMFVMPLLRRKYLLIEAETLAETRDRAEVEWMVGRFIGALAARHYRFMLFEIILDATKRFMIFNLLLYPYDRAVQYTGDQLGLVAMGGDLGPATRAICKLMAGRDAGAQVNVDGVILQSQEIRGSFFAWLVKVLSPYPHLSSRMTNLYRFAAQHYPDHFHHAARQVRSRTAGKVLANVRRAA